jgi:hypothetical protein
VLYQLSYLAAAPVYRGPAHGNGNRDEKGATSGTVLPLLEGRSVPCI